MQATKKPREEAAPVILMTSSRESRSTIEGVKTPSQRRESREYTSSINKPAPAVDSPTEIKLPNIARRHQSTIRVDKIVPAQRATTTVEQPLGVFNYRETGIQIGKGKWGPVELIVHDSKLRALKRVPKTILDNRKRIQHIINEKSIL